MKFDFTIKVYKELIKHLLNNGYTFQTLEKFIESPNKKSIIIRHDIDRFGRAALKFASLEFSYGIKATYYFRIIPQSFKPKVIKKIVSFGHEIGYHYEDLAKHNGDINKAIISFRKNLETFRKFYPIRTISMHGSSGSPFDNRDMWNKYNYKNFGIIAEPYLDLDFNDILYLTDTGQTWADTKIALRDRVETNYTYDFEKTFDIIDNIDILPNRIMFTIHPHRWSDNLFEYIFINFFVFLQNSYKIYYRNKKILKKQNKF